MTKSADTSTALQLVVENGDVRGRAIVLTGPALSIGSAPVTDLHLSGDPEVRRVHAEVVRDGDGYEIRALEGAPLTVNGAAATKRRLQAGDRIRIGRYVIRLAGAGVPSSPAGVRETLAPAADPRPDVGRVVGGSVARQLRLMPLWLRLYLAAIAVVGIYLAATHGGSSGTLDEIVRSEHSYAATLQRPDGETDKVVRLLLTAAAYESRGDRSSAIELYREVLVARTPPDPTTPAAVFAARRLGELTGQ